MSTYQVNSCAGCYFGQAFDGTHYHGVRKLIMCRRYPPTVLTENGKLSTNWPVIPENS